MSECTCEDGSVVHSDNCPVNIDNRFQKLEKRLDNHFAICIIVSSKTNMRDIADSVAEFLDNLRDS